MFIASQREFGGKTELAKYGFDYRDSNQRWSDAFYQFLPAPPHAHFMSLLTQEGWTDRSPESVASWKVPSFARINSEELSEHLGLSFGRPQWAFPVKGPVWFGFGELFHSVGGWDGLSTVLKSSSWCMKCCCFISTAGRATEDEWEMCRPREIGGKNQIHPK